MINKNLTELLDYAIERNLITEEDVNYVVNRILNLIGGSSYEREEYTPHSNIEEILAPILDYADANGKLEVNSITYRDILSTDIMDCFTPIPSVVTKTFYEKYEESPKEATDWFFKLSDRKSVV